MGFFIKPAIPVHLILRTPVDHIIVDIVVVFLITHCYGRRHILVIYCLLHIELLFKLHSESTRVLRNATMRTDVLRPALSTDTNCLFFSAFPNDRQSLDFNRGDLL